MGVAKKVLVADDEAIIRRVLEQELVLAGYEVETAVDGQQTLDLCEKESFSAIILDMKMPDRSGLEVLRKLRRDKDTVIILITAYAAIDHAVEAIKLGADDYLTKPFDNQELMEKLERFMRLKSGRGAYLPPEMHASPSYVIGSSDLANSLMRKMEKIKDIDTTVLITGESGTGKSLIAKTLHAMGNRRNEAFSHVDCAGLPESLMESELFGHEKGAFTGAFEQRKGKFEQAGEGTIFLDEIGCLPMLLQSKLLNVLQERQVFRIGGSEPRPIRARILAATNEDLEEAVGSRRFRRDLYYRLNVIRLECAPLRYRKEDIPALARHFIRRHCRNMNMAAVDADPTFWECVNAYDWPGNMRELENVLESALALIENDVITADDLPMRIRSAERSTGEGEPGAAGAAADGTSLRDQEFAIILKSLQKNGGHRQKTAEELGISRRTLQYKLKKMKELGIIFLR